MIRFAKFEEHDKIMKLAKRSKYTRDFSNHIFSGESMYSKNWIAIQKDALGDVMGFYCVRHKVRTPATTLYFIGVDQKYWGEGNASELLQHMKDNTPHRCIELNCMKDNVEGLKFYEKHNFEIKGDSLKGLGHKLELRW